MKILCEQSGAVQTNLRTVRPESHCDPHRADRQPSARSSHGCETRAADTLGMACLEQNTRREERVQWHSDEMLAHLKKHLTPLERQGQITIWSDTNLNAGVEWEKELHRHLERADIILLLISPDFNENLFHPLKRISRGIPCGCPANQPHVSLGNGYPQGMPLRSSPGISQNG